MNRQHTFLYMWNLETLRTIHDRETVRKEEGASVGDCTLNLRWNPWLVSTYGKQRKSTPVRTRLVFWDVWNSSPCAPTFPSLEQSHHSWCTLDRLTPCLGVQTHKIPSVQMQHCPSSVLRGTHGSFITENEPLCPVSSWGHRASPCWKTTVFIFSRFHVSFCGENGKKRQLRKISKQLAHAESRHIASSYDSWPLVHSLWTPAWKEPPSSKVVCSATALSSACGRQVQDTGEKAMLAQQLKMGSCGWGLWMSQKLLAWCAFCAQQSMWPMVSWICLLNLIQYGESLGQERPKRAEEPGFWKTLHSLLVNLVSMHCWHTPRSKVMINVCFGYCLKCWH